MIAAEAATMPVRNSRMRRLAVPAIVLLAGCSTDIGPSREEMKTQWEQQNVFPQSYKSDLLAFLRTYLNDPSHVRGAAVTLPVRKDVGAGERYVACVRYDARKSDGKYAGPKEGAAIYVSGKLDRFLDTPLETKQYCKDAAFQPFPELETLAR